MNIYKISQDINTDYDTYDAAIVAAETEEEARSIHPGEYQWADTWNDTWVSNPNDVKVEYLGIAKEGTKKGEILASFHAG